MITLIANNEEVKGYGEAHGLNIVNLTHKVPKESWAIWVDTYTENGNYRKRQYAVGRVGRSDWSGLYMRFPYSHHGDIAKAVAKAKAAERGEESARNIEFRGGDTVVKHPQLIDPPMQGRVVKARKVRYGHRDSAGSRWVVTVAWDSGSIRVLSGAQLRKISRAAERGEESARRDAGMVSNDPRSAAHGGVA